jgi:hypothetical protein
LDLTGRLPLGIIRRPVGLRLPSVLVSAVEPALRRIDQNVKRRSSLALVAG